MKLKDRTYTRTGINWDNFFKDAGVYAIRSLPKSLQSPVLSAARNRGFQCETQDAGGDYMVFIFRRNRTKDRILKALSGASERELKAIFNAAIELGIIDENEGGES
jgi:hypothetical protein